MTVERVMVARWRMDEGEWLEDTRSFDTFELTQLEGFFSVVAPLAVEAAPARRAYSYGETLRRAASSESCR